MLEQEFETFQNSASVVVQSLIVLDCQNGLVQRHEKTVAILQGVKKIQE